MEAGTVATRSVISACGVGIVSDGDGIGRVGGCTIQLEDTPSDKLGPLLGGLSVDSEFSP